MAKTKQPARDPKEIQYENLKKAIEARGITLEEVPQKMEEMRQYFRDRAKAKSVS